MPFRPTALRHSLLPLGSALALLALAAPADAATLAARGTATGFGPFALALLALLVTATAAQHWTAAAPAGSTEEDPEPPELDGAPWHHYRQDP